MTTGIQYLEFRLFDLNPFEIYGISLKDAKFIHVFALFMIWMDHTADQEEVELGKARLAEVAFEHPLENRLCRRRRIGALRIIVDARANWRRAGII